MTKKKSSKPKVKNPEFGVDSRYSSKSEQLLDGQRLMEARLERMRNVSIEEIIAARLLQLKLNMDQFLANFDLIQEHSFTSFLSQYIAILYDRRSDFADDMGVTAIRLSQIINGHRNPKQEFIFRLMVHSEMVYQGVADFPKERWYRIYQHDMLCRALANESQWRKEAEKHVRLNRTAG